MRVRATLVTLFGMTTTVTTIAAAQPSDPYATTADVTLDEQIAESLVARAQELLEAGEFLDAKQLAKEALIKSPNGGSAGQARTIVLEVDKKLGLTAPRQTFEQPDMTPIQDPTEVRVPGPVPPQVDAPVAASGDAVLAGRVHAGVYGGVVGAMFGSLLADGNKGQAVGAVAGGLALGGLGAVFAPRVVDRLGWNEAQVRTVGTGSVWGGVIGGFFAEAVGVNTTTGRHVLVGASLGSTLLGAAGAGLATRNKLTRGDLALTDTLAGIGAAGGLTLGMLMQPAEGEAYSVNAILGTMGGLLVGYVAGPQTNTTPRRMLRVAGVSAAGGAAPFLLYPLIRDGETTGDERAVGALSTIGLLAGAYVGFRLTRDLDAGLDVLEGGTPKVDDAPPAVVGRHSDGRWGLGALSVQPLSPVLAPQPGMTVPLVGGSFL